MDPRFTPLSPGNLERQGRNRTRYGRPIYGYDLGENIYSDFYLNHLTNDPIIRPMYGISGSPRGARIRQSNCVYEGDSGGERDIRRPRHARMDARDTKDALFFGKAMTKLHQQLTKSVQFYGDFKSGYENDIMGIKKYATEDTLLSLWTLRVKGQKDPKAAGDQNGDEDLIEAAEKFPSMKKKLREALAEASCSILSEGKALGRKGEIRLESAKRLKDKVILARSQVLFLLELLPRGYEHCEALVDELENLKALADPDNEKNKELYKGGDCEGRGASIYGGGGAQAEGPW